MDNKELLEIIYERMHVLKSDFLSISKSIMEETAIKCMKIEERLSDLENSVPHIEKVFDIFEKRIKDLENR